MPSSGIASSRAGMCSTCPPTPTGVLLALRCAPTLYDAGGQRGQEPPRSSERRAQLYPLYPFSPCVFLGSGTHSAKLAQLVQYR